MEDKILTLDVSSKLIKVAILSDKLNLEKVIEDEVIVIDENLDGFAKKFDMSNLWTKICLAIKQLLSSYNKDEINILGISTCAQRIASVFIDHKGNELYGGPNTDMRGIDSAYIIDDNITEKELFAITGHTPSLLFTLARILWFKEESEDIYEKIDKILMLDDWLVYRLTGEVVSDATSAAESQLLDINNRTWSDKLINTFDLNSDLFPPIVETGSIIEQLRPNLIKLFDISQKHVPIIKSGGDTQTSLLGMGALNEGDIGITLGTTCPIQLVTKKPFFDSECNYWTTCHSPKSTWLIEAHAGNTGAAYNWFKDGFITNKSNEKDIVIDQYLKETKPGALSSYAYLGPERMNIKNQTSIKRGVFVFQPPQLINGDLPQISHFARSVIENIIFGILENYNDLLTYISSTPRLLCAGGMAKSTEFCKILASAVDHNILIPCVKESSFIGAGINVLKGLHLYPDYNSIVKDLIGYENINQVIEMVNSYKIIYKEWKIIKEKIDNL